MIHFRLPSRMFSGQSGAMFGMDARIALIIAAILASVGGWQMMSRLESSKVDAAQQQAEQLKDALDRYYQTKGINHLPNSLEELFTEGVITDPSLKTDPWGAPWEYAHSSAQLRFEDMPVTTQFAVIYSRGKNGLNDSGGFSGLDDFAQWAPGKDDVGTKYISRDVERKRIDEYRGRAQLIIDKLEAAESSAFLEAQNTCGGDSPPAWCTDTAGKNYTLFNFYPKADSDDTTDVIYYSEKVANKPVYSSGNVDDMQQLMIDLGLPANYATDPWGRILMYNPNVTGRTIPPFSASICFSAGENCLARKE
ncbi:MAG: hypothetical protein GC129_05790 [Proteobacteria bacterium]|nr:hypothetical protein [Pseudomonadota bacterium]